MKKLIFIFGIFVFASVCLADSLQDANAFFAKGDYLSGMNIMTKAITSPDPNQKANALYFYAKFYDNIMGNHTYSLMLYTDILKINNPLRLNAQQEIEKLRKLKTQYSAEDLLLKKLKPAEILSQKEIDNQLSELKSIIDKKPQYYRIAEVYYYLGRSLMANKNYKQAYLSLKKVVELKPAINFYLPVNVYKEQAYISWIRATAKTISRNSAGILLIITFIAFYSVRPWKWLNSRHLKFTLVLIISWVIFFAFLYIFFGLHTKISDKVIAEVGAPVPCFINIQPGNPHWHIAKNLFFYGLIGTIGIFLFSISTSRLKGRILPAILNSLYALILFATLMTIFYIQNCDQKSFFYAHDEQDKTNYAKSSNYFITIAMEPYILTNPKSYPNLAIDNVSDIYMKEWIRKYCPVTKVK